MSSDPDHLTFGEKFARLIESRRASGRGTYSDKEIAAKIGVSPVYVWQLRRGKRGEPRAGTVHAICEALGVPRSYFDDAEEPDASDVQHGAEVSATAAVADPEANQAFAVKLRRLFASMRTESGDQYTQQDLAEAVGVTPGVIADLLAGATDPSHAVVVKIAEFFSVDLEFFSDSERGRELNRQHELLAKLGAQNVQQLAARASELSPEKLRNVLEYIDFQASQDKNPSE